MAFIGTLKPQSTLHPGKLEATGHSVRGMLLFFGRARNHEFSRNKRWQKLLLLCE
jgi:hypothetical protein